MPTPIEHRRDYRSDQPKKDLYQSTAKVLIGVDIAKDTFEAASLWLDPQDPTQRSSVRRREQARFANTQAGIGRFIAFLRRLVRCQDELTASRDLHVVMEATGVYHLPLATALARQGLPVSVVNPLQIKRFGQMRLRRVKTDRADAQLIAAYGAREPLRLFRPPSPAQQQLKQISRTLAQLAKQKTMLSNVLHAASYPPSASEVCQAELEQVLGTLRASMRRLEQEQERLAKLAYPETYALLRSIRGVGPKVAGALLGYVGQMEHFVAAKQLAAYAGLVPQPDQSGTKDGPRHISKAGHAHLRTLLYMGAMTAARHNASCRALYERMRGRGKAHKVAMIAVANKLVRQIFAVVKSGEAYIDDYEEQFALAA